MGEENFRNWVSVIPQPKLQVDFVSTIDIYYRVNIPGMPETTICIRVDNDGNLFLKNLNANNNPNRGIPDCRNHPELCTFLSQDSITKIAEKQLFEKGMSPWRHEFVWVNVNTFKENDCPSILLAGHYVWKVSNTLSVHDKLAKGKTIQINASTGEVENIGEWKTQGMF